MGPPITLVADDKGTETRLARTSTKQSRGVILKNGN
jgi:hypothetical protein